MQNGRILSIAAGGDFPDAVLRGLRLLGTVDRYRPGYDDNIHSVPPRVAIVSAAAIHEPARVRALGLLLEPLRRRQVPLLFLLAEPTTRDIVQARALGASAVGPVAMPPRELIALLQPLLDGNAFGAVPSACTEIRLAMQQVGVAIADMLSQAAQGAGGLGPAVTEETALCLLDAVREDGIDRWLQVVGTVDDRTYKHCLLVAGFVAAFTLQLGLDAPACSRLTQSALLHDVGKALMPIEILDKPDRLTVAETAVLRTHPVIGYRLLADQGQHPRSVLDVVRHHHEALDGSGYPDGLRGSAIPYAVRVVTICDVFTALTEHRPYKEASDPMHALGIMRGQVGKFDPDLLQSFATLFVTTA